MKQEHCYIQNSLSCMEGVKTIPLFAGIELAYLSLTGGDSFSIQHKEAFHIMAINYCKSGRIGWKMESGNYVYLGAGDFSVHMMNLCANSEINLPNENYEGISIYIDLQEITSNPPALLLGTGITGTALYEKLCKNDTIISLMGNEYTEKIFQFFIISPKTHKLHIKKF